MKQNLLAAFFVLASAAYSAAPLPSVYIAPMENNLDGFITAEIVNQHLPMRVVGDEKDAQFMLVGNSGKTEGNIRLLDVQSKAVLWAGDADDKSLVKHGGLRKVAERIAQKMNKDFFGIPVDESVNKKSINPWANFGSTKKIFNF